jgi:hypothetical protein
MSKHNLALLIDAARLLRPLLNELVFVGGCTTALFITDKAAPDVRPTYDVDAIAEITSYAGYAEFSERLRRQGFAEDVSEGAPICRWRLKKTILDVMPIDEKILGFSNRWYQGAIDSATVHELESIFECGPLLQSSFAPRSLKRSRAAAVTTFRAAMILKT